MAAAQPRDFVLDHRGLAYLKGKGGVLKPYGHNVPATPEPRAKGGKGGGKPSDGNGGGNTGGSGFTNIVNSEWGSGGIVQEAAGRIFFVMDGQGYVCSGTLIDDGETVSDRSIILTAAHCVYDDANDAFAEVAIFIPNQTATTGSGTDVDCANDPKGCWIADFGVVSTGWDADVFPNNISSDYGFYALGTNTEITQYSSFKNEGRNVSMDSIIAPMKVSFDFAVLEDYTRALGYSYSDDPHFMYCGEPVAGSNYDGYLLSNCGLSGGASGGPWSQSQEHNLGTGPIISVNSYGPARGRFSYMGGPRLDNNDASCLFEQIKAAPSSQTEGIVTTCN